MDSFVVPVEHLTDGSNKKVNVKCDVCGKEKHIKYQDYVNSFSKRGVYACSSKCAHFKNKETNIEKYGYEYSFQSESVQSQLRKKMIEEHGVDNYSKTDEFKEKYESVMSIKYGVRNYFQAEEFDEKRRKSCIERYGSEHHNKTEEYKNRYHRGNKCHFYIDGRNDGAINRKTDADYREWRNAVFSRDGFTCQCCGSTESGSFNAHHLYSWNSYIELRYDVDNGITLCKECHKDFHDTCGYGDNTREQYEKWLNIKEELNG